MGSSINPNSSSGSQDPATQSTLFQDWNPVTLNPNTPASETQQTGAIAIPNELIGYPQAQNLYWQVNSFERYVYSAASVLQLNGPSVTALENTVFTGLDSITTQLLANPSTANNLLSNLNSLINNWNNNLPAAVNSDYAAEGDANASFQAIQRYRTSATRQQGYQTLGTTSNGTTIYWYNPQAAAIDYPTVSSLNTSSIQTSANAWLTLMISGQYQYLPGSPTSTYPASGAISLYQPTKGGATTMLGIQEVVSLYSTLENSNLSESDLSTAISTINSNLFTGQPGPLAPPAVDE